MHDKIYESMIRTYDKLNKINRSKQWRTERIENKKGPTNNSYKVNFNEVPC